MVIKRHLLFLHILVNYPVVGFCRLKRGSFVSSQFSTVRPRSPNCTWLLSSLVHATALHYDNPNIAKVIWYLIVCFHMLLHSCIYCAMIISSCQVPEVVLISGLLFRSRGLWCLHAELFPRPSCRWITVCDNSEYVLPILPVLPTVGPRHILI